MRIRDKRRVFLSDSMYPDDDLPFPIAEQFGKWLVVCEWWIGYGDGGDYTYFLFDTFWQAARFAFKNTRKKGDHNATIYLVKSENEWVAYERQMKVERAIHKITLGKLSRWIEYPDELVIFVERMKVIMRGE